MITSRKEALDKVAQYTALFEKIKDRRCILSFSKHSFTDVIPHELKLATQNDLKYIKPNKKDVDGKLKTPFVFTIITDVGNLNFLLDDTIVAPLTNGLRFQIGYDVDLRLE